MTDDEPTGRCVVCQTRDPRPELEPACGPCRSRLTNQLREVPRLCDLLAAGPRAEVARDGSLVSLAAGPVPGLSSSPRVAGSREAPIPIRVDALDLLGPVDERTVHDVYGDQVGYTSAATILDSWCRMFAEERRESTPRPHVTDQCKWLSDRLDELFKHPAIDEAAKEIGDLWHVLRRTAGLTIPKPELCEGVPCRRIECDLKTLYRLPGSEFIECQSCGQLLTEDEYQAWVKLVAAAARRKTVVPGQ